MLCSLLRVIQLYVASTALFSTSSTVYVDKNYQPVAVNYALVHPSSHINQTYTVVYQPEYMECFIKADMNPPQLILNATEGMDGSLLAPLLVNHTDLSPPVCKKCKPCATRPSPTRFPYYPPPYYQQPYYPPAPATVPSSGPATRPVGPSPTHSPPPQPYHPPYHPPATPATPLTEVSRSGTPRPTAAPIQTPSKLNKPLHDDTYISCVKAPQHLHGKVWETAKFIDIAYHTEYARIDQCASACKEQDFQYYAMESGTRCWCAQSEPMAHPIDDLFCSVCSDDSKRTCGNVNYGFMSVYKVNHPQLTLPRLEKTPTFDSKYVSMVLPANHDWKRISKQAPIKPVEEDDDDDDDDAEKRKQAMRRHLFESLKNQYRKKMLRHRIQHQTSSRKEKVHKE